MVLLLDQKIKLSMISISIVDFFSFYSALKFPVCEFDSIYFK